MGNLKVSFTVTYFGVYFWLWVSLRSAQLLAMSELGSGLIHFVKEEWFRNLKFVANIAKS